MVKRYGDAWDYDQCGDPIKGMGEAVDGEYVLFEDYDELAEASAELLKLAIEHMCQDDEAEEAVVSRVQKLLYGEV